jgi:hypothetical protein
LPEEQWLEDVEDGPRRAQPTQLRLAGQHATSDMVMMMMMMMMMTMMMMMMMTRRHVIHIRFTYRLPTPMRFTYPLVVSR